MESRNTRSQMADFSMGMDDDDSLFDSYIMGDTGIHISDDGERGTEVLHNITHKKRRLRLRPENLADDLASWIPVHEDGFDLFAQGEEDLATLYSVTGTGDAETGSKRKAYTSSDNPMSEFKEVRQLILDETLRRAGLGDTGGQDHLSCALCHKHIEPTAVVPPETGLVSPSSIVGGIFRCGQCGEFKQCRACCLDLHTRTPLHSVEEWNGNFWESTSLFALGFVYQLGHGGLRCPVPETTLRTMVVMDVHAIYKVKYRLCGCDLSDTAKGFRQVLRNAWFPATATDPDTCATFEALEMFRHHNVIGNLNVYDFVKALERKTSALGSIGLNKVPDRYKAFLRMSRQYAFLQRCRRAGRGHDEGGIDATALGELMVMCWACPFDGRNLPEGWRDVEPRYRFMYRLIVAMDANFKLKNRIRVNERADPSLGPGWGAFVEPEKYKEHLCHYVAENDISTCIAFAALTQKETCNTAGLRVSGVGGCVCARHEYANMDYILMSALAGFDLMELTVSYDVACQWRKRLAERLEKLPEDMRLDIEHILFQCGLPVWHASSHEADCTNRNSLSFKPGVAKSDGEGIERLWAQLNACAFHTKTMGIGNRADTIEDKIDYLNFMKNIGEADILRRKLVVAVPERERQVAAFKEVNKSIPPETRAEWQGLIDAFLADGAKPNPYVVTTKDGPSEAEIRVLLKKDEEEAADKGTAPLHAVSATAFLTAGLQMEDTQRRIKAEIAGTTVITADRESKIQEMRLALQAKLRPFRSLQQVYTPGAITALEADDAARNVEASPVKAEHIKLYLPSGLSAAQRARGCQEKLIDMEGMLREAQCTDALSLLRACLHAKRHVIYSRGSNVTGQVGGRRSQTLLSQLGDRIDAVKRKYNDARTALTRLRGPEYAPHLKMLTQADLSLDGDVKDDEAVARKKLELIAAGKGARVPRHVNATSRTVMSWIWAAEGALEESEQILHESLRVEWARAKARKNRWEEEVTTLREEMRRVLRYLNWEDGRWEEKAEETLTRTDLPQGTMDGVRAYALKQAATHRAIRAKFFALLDVSVGAAAGSVAAGADILEEGADLNGFFTQGIALTHHNELVMQREDEDPVYRGDVAPELSCSKIPQPARWELPQPESSDGELSVTLLSSDLPELTDTERATSPLPELTDTESASSPAPSVRASSPSEQLTNPTTPSTIRARRPRLTTYSRADKKRVHEERVAKAKADAQAKRDAAAAQRKAKHDAEEAKRKAKRDIAEAKRKATAKRQIQRALRRAQFPLPTRRSRRLRQGRAGDLGEGGALRAEELLREGHQLHKWIDNLPRPLIDRDGKVMAVVAGAPKGDEVFWADVNKTATRDLTRLSLRGDFTRFGEAESVFQFGVGFGLLYPAPQYIRERVPVNRKELKYIKESVSFKAMSAYMNHLYRQIAPAAYTDISCKVGELVDRRIILPPFSNSVFTTGEISFCDAPALSRKNFDSSPGTLEAICSVGQYDYNTGGFCHFWDDEGMIEVPPGTTILFPAGKRYSFMPVGKGEKRYLFRQFCNAGVVRWIEKDGMSDSEFDLHASPEAIEAWEEKRLQRGPTAARLFTKLNDVFFL
ncbi:hypothetical protein C8R43DRAFT_1138108 [Mycena crocata]|nr:hypothetical protein C8R43DRAFT_1138108 [Mycena crocata]